MEGSITLTMKEKRMNEIITKFMSKEINITQACRISGLSERQIYRKQKLYKEKGIDSIPHQLKLNPSKKGYSKKLKDRIISIYKEEYMGWNFHHFNDCLEDFYHIKVSDSFIYNLFTLYEIDSPYKYKNRRKSHPPRERRENAGELIQVDASKHQWFDGDDTYYYLHGGIDDATGTVTSCFFQREETIYGYQKIMEQTMRNYGIPECLYTDFRTVFQSTKQELTLEEELDGKQIKNTRFTNMLEHIGTDIISTINPRAKGRIERLWRTFQDRLYKELKKKNIHTIEEANVYLTNTFIPKYNVRFALPIDNTKNVFICLDEEFDYNKELAVWSDHKIHHNSYLKYDKKYHVILENDEKIYLPTSSKAPIYTFVDGTQHLLFNDKWYDLKTVSEYKPTATITNKTIEINHTTVKNNTKKNTSPWHKWNPKKVF